MFPKMNDPRFRSQVDRYGRNLKMYQSNYLKQPVNLDISHRCPLQCGACHRQT